MSALNDRVTTADGKRTIHAYASASRTRVTIERECPNDVVPNVSIDRLDRQAALELGAAIIAAALQLEEEAL